MKLYSSLTLALIITTITPAYASVLYVSEYASGANDGASWQNAFHDLQNALSVAQSGDEIWVATGTYKPDRGTGDRSMTFNLVDGVNLFGGFAGWEECLEDRDWTANETILSGDLNDDDGPSHCAEYSDCCREHEAPTCDDAECLSIVCQQSPGCCNGMLNQWYGQCALAAATYCCKIGGRNSCENSYHVVDLVDANSGAQTSLDGFTIRGAYDVVPRDGWTTGSGLYARNAHYTEIRNCRFENNTPYGIWWYQGVDIRLSNCTFVNNTHTGVRGDALSAEISDSLFDSNGYRGIWGIGGNLNVTRSAFRNHRYWEAAINVDGVVRVSDCSFLHNAGTGIYTIGFGVAFVDRCTFAHNVGYGGGGRAQVRNSIFVDNGSPNAWVISGVGVFDNCTIVAGSGIGLEAGSASLYLRNSTLVGNKSRGINLGYSTLHLSNSILWANGTSNAPSESRQISTGPGSNSFDISDSIIEGWTGMLGGVGNSGVDPLFQDATGPDGIAGTDDDNLRLLPGSPAINGGDPSFVPYDGETDLDGHARVLCGAVDIGAYEFGAGDFNCDQSVDLGDQAYWAECMTNPRASAVRPGCEAFDFNGDSDVDLADYTYLQRVFVAP